MGVAKLKKGNEERVVGFNNSLLPLGKRDDLDKLAEMAVRSKDQSLIDLFETVPTLKELDKAKAAKFLEETKNIASANDDAKDDKSNSSGGQG